MKIQRESRISPGAQLLANCHMASRLAGLLSICVGLVALAGYAPMLPSTALGILLYGAALWLDDADLASEVCAGMASLIGVVSLTGRMTMMPALALALLGGALFLSRHRFGFAVGQYLVIIASIL